MSPDHGRPLAISFRMLIPERPSQLVMWPAAFRESRILWMIYVSPIDARHPIGLNAKRQRRISLIFKILQTKEHICTVKYIYTNDPGCGSAKS
jgi:hypothetical protein